MAKPLRHNILPDFAANFVASGLDTALRDLRSVLSGGLTLEPFFALSIKELTISSSNLPYTFAVPHAVAAVWCLTHYDTTVIPRTFRHMSEVTWQKGTGEITITAIANLAANDSYVKLALWKTM